jgi:S1-C subfamily serine protease
MRSRLVLIGIGCAAVGAGATLAVVGLTGWLREGTTVVIGPRSAVGSDRAPPPVLPAASEFDAPRIYRDRASGVVTIYAQFDEDHPGPESQGSGFVVSEDGYVLTNAHVITTAGTTASGAARPAGTVYVEFLDGARVPARIVGFDPFADVGVIKVDPELHRLAPVPLGDSRAVVVGEPVAAIGSPFGQAGSLTVGVVSAVERSIAALLPQFDLVGAIQTDAPINQGNSGGPLLNGAGEAIGINAQIRTDTGTSDGVGFAVPIAAALRSLEQLVEHGKVRYAWIGVVTKTLTPGLAQRLGYAASEGAAIQQVVDRSPAARAGLRGGRSPRTVDGVEFWPGGDVIVAIDGEPVRRSEDVSRIVVSRLEPGALARLEIDRSGERVRVDVRLGERPTDPADE